MQKEHNYGIDLLRVVLMLLIITGHLLIHTGVSSSLVDFSSKWFISFSYMSIITCSVDCAVATLRTVSKRNNPLHLWCLLLYHSY